MLFKSNILCIFNLVIITAPGFKFIGIHNGCRRLIKEIRSAAALTIAPIQTGWIKQKLDHFNAKENRTWKMRYFKRLDYWRRNGPIYIFISGESTAYPDFIKIGLVQELAKETNGAIFMTEHRYYGKSKPVKMSNVAAMKYLTTPQALADIAEVIKKIKKKPKFRRSKVVLAGASYAGNLAAWMKLVYPDIVDAAIASSAPILAKRDFYEFLEVITEDYTKYGTKNCVHNIKNIFKRYDSLFKTKVGIKQLKKEEKVCNDVDLAKPENKILFFTAKIEPFVSIVHNGLSDIDYNCNNINQTTSSDLFETSDDQFWIEDQNCYNYDFNNMVQRHYNDEDEYSWAYQTCTEYGYFVSTTSNKQPFSKNFPVEWNDNLCTALFGAKFNKYRVIDGVRKINQMYGGRSPNVTKVVFVNGELDPWKSLSVLKDISKEAPAVYIKKASHSSDLFPERDEMELKSAKMYIKYFIKKWIIDIKPKTFEFNLTLHVDIVK